MRAIHPPPGQATGCKPRTTKYGECCDKLEDRFEIITDEGELRQAIERPREETLLSCVPSIFSQGRVGSCASEAGTGALKVLREFNGLPFAELSPWSMYCFTSGGRDNGSSVGETLLHLRETGVLTMETWPRSIPWHLKPSAELLAEEACNYRADEYFDTDSIDELRTALALNFPVQFGWRGHSCVLLALKTLDSAYYLNSWGSDWTETDMPGIGVIRLRDVDLRYEAWAMRSHVVAS